MTPCCAQHGVEGTGDRGVSVVGCGVLVEQGGDAVGTLVYRIATCRTPS